MPKTYYQCIMESMEVGEVYTFEEIRDLISTKVTYKGRVNHPYLDMSKKTMDIARNLSRAIDNEFMIQLRTPKEKAMWVRHKYMKIV